MEVTQPRKERTWKWQRQNEWLTNNNNRADHRQELFLQLVTSRLQSYPQKFFSNSAPNSLIPVFHVDLNVLHDSIADRFDVFHECLDIKFDEHLFLVEILDHISRQSAYRFLVKTQPRDNYSSSSRHFHCLFNWSLAQGIGTPQDSDDVSSKGIVEKEADVIVAAPQVLENKNGLLKL